MTFLIILLYLLHENNYLNSFCYAVILTLFLSLFCISSSAISDYRQSLQFQNLNEEKRNIQVEVMSTMKLYKFVLFKVLTNNLSTLMDKKCVGDQRWSKREGVNI